jgi:protein-S-isoprenylcysteine O-methyltransferase Ste14
MMERLISGKTMALLKSASNGDNPAEFDEQRPTAPAPGELDQSATNNAGELAPAMSAKAHWIVNFRSWVSVLIIAPFGIATALSVPIFDKGSVADFCFSMGGWICFSAGTLFRWWATLYIGGMKQRALASEGPYSICRNPLYLGTLLLTLSIAFFLHSLTFAVGVLIALPIYLSITVPWEEAQLTRVFGDEFAQYRTRVPKFIPNFKLLASQPVISVRLSGLSAEFRNALYWMWIPFLAQYAAHVRLEPWWPATFHLP